MVENALYIQRSIRSDDIPSVVAQNPAAYLQQFLNGHFYVRLNPENIITRDPYSYSPFQVGKYSYRLTLYVDPEIQQRMSDIDVVQITKKNTIDGKVAQENRYRMDQLISGYSYSKMFIPDQWVSELLNSCILYGGDGWGSANLNKLHYGIAIPHKVHKLIDWEMGWRGFGNKERK